MVILEIEAERNIPLSQIATLVAAIGGAKDLESIAKGVNLQAQALARLKARQTIDPTTAGLILKTRYPQEILSIVPLEMLELAAAENPILPPGHIGYLGSHQAWVCNARPDQDGLWCGALLVYAPGTTELVDWDSGRRFRVKIPQGVLGGLAVKLEWGYDS